MIVLRSQEDLVLDLINQSGTKGVTPQDILDLLDQTPAYANKPRRDGKVYWRTPSHKINLIRSKFGQDIIQTVTINGQTRYYPKGIIVTISMKDI